MRQAEIMLLEKSLEGNLQAISETEKNINLIVDQRSQLEVYMTQKLPATFEKVRQYDMKSSQIQTLRIIENCDSSSLSTTPQLLSGEVRTSVKI